jgi:hypothetical protein
MLLLFGAARNIVMISLALFNTNSVWRAIILGELNFTLGIYFVIILQLSFQVKWFIIKKYKTLSGNPEVADGYRNFNGGSINKLLLFPT